MISAPWLTPPQGLAAAQVAALHAAMPRIETARLMLRPVQISDWPALAPIWTGPRSIHIGGPMSDEDAWLDFNQCVASWLLRGTGPLTITRKGDDAPLGIVLIAQEYGDPMPELGWLLTADAEGHGYATEAATALRDYGFGVLGRDAFVSYIAPGNAASIKVAERLGAVRLADAHPADPTCLVYGYGGAS